MKLKIQYQVIEIEDVIAYFVKGFEGKNNNYDWFYDPNKGKIVLRLYVAGKE